MVMKKMIPAKHHPMAVNRPPKMIQMIFAIVDKRFFFHEIHQLHR